MAPPAAANAVFVSRSTALVYAGGAVIAWVSTVLPGGPPSPGTTVVRALGALALVLVPLVWRWGPTLPGWSWHLWAAVAAVMVAVGVAFSGGGPLTVAYITLYAVIVIHVFSVFSWALASGHLLVVLAVVTSLLVREGVRPASLAVCAAILVLVAATVGALARAGSVVEMDPLTGVLNRRGLDRHLAAVLARAGRRGTRVVVVVLDLDDFKSVNDALGHAGGDELLVTAARAWAAAQRREGVRGVLSRQGGDEFVAVLTGATPEQVARVVAGTRSALPEGQSCSAGTAQWTGALPSEDPGRGETGEALLRRADAALYRAKRTAKGSTVSAGTSPDPGLDLRRGLEVGELVVHYQPVLQLAGDPGGRPRDGARGEHRADWCVVGAEALVRWQHPTRGLLAPAAFLADVSTARLAPQLGRTVLGRVVQEARTWTTASGAPLPVSVNAGAEELRSPRYAEEVLAQLEASGFAPGRLCVEVVEDDLHGAEVALKNLRQLRERGVRVAVDDFGVGYSNLSRLTSLPVDVLKVDRSLTRAASCDGRASAPLAVLSAVLSLAVGADLQVVVEGVETQGQARWLAEQLDRRALVAAQPEPGISGQGWFWSPAVPAQDLGALLAAPA